MDRGLRKIILFHFLIFFLRGLYAVLGPADLFIEEAQYWLWSKRPDLSYYSKPPLVAYFNYFSTSLLGDTELAVKINGLVLGFIYSLLTYTFTIELLGNRKKAFLASLLVYAMPLNHTVFNVFMTDAPLLVFWSLGTIFFWRALRYDIKRDWVLLGVFIGLGFLSKYAMLLFGITGLAYVLLYKKKVLSNPWLYLSALIAAIMMVPVLHWNFQHDFISFKHVSAIGSRDFTFSDTIKSVSEYLGGQIGFISPFLMFLLVPAVGKILRKRDEIRMYLLIAPAVVLGFFFIYSLFRRVEVNWTFFAYFSIPILISDYAVDMKREKKLSVLAIASVVLIFAAFYFSYYLQSFGLGKILPPKRDPIVRLYGWEKLGREVDLAINEAELNRFFVFSDSYHVASEVAFYSKSTGQPININLGRRLNQFDLWPGIEQYEFQQFDGVYVSANDIPQSLRDAFREIDNSRKVEIILGGEVIKTFTITICREFTTLKETEVPVY